MEHHVEKALRWIFGIAAASLTTYFLLTEGRDSLPILLASVFLLLAVGTDTARSKIPNLLTLPLLLAGLGYHVSRAGSAGLLESALGFLAGLGLLLIPYALGGMGGGDVKALAALGAVLGPSTIFQVFLYTGLIGGLLALLYWAFNGWQRRKTKEALSRFRTFLLTRDAKGLRQMPSEGKQTSVRFPYAVAMAFGFSSFLQWGKLI